MTWKLYLDDIRNPPPGFDCARSSGHAIDLVTEFGPPSHMSLDHDLGGDDTAMRFLKWLSTEHYDATFTYTVHSANPVGAANIKAYIDSWLRSRQEVT